MMMVHTNVFAPKPTWLTVVVALDAEEIVAVPPLKVHVPCPVCGRFAAMVAVPAQMVASVAVTAWSGSASLITNIVSASGAQMPFTTVQTKTWVPVLTETAVL